MKIVHVYTQNVQMWVDAVSGTDCRLNASRDIDYLLSSLHSYNARDVLGLIVFANPMTKKCLRLIKKFDELFVLQPMPIIVINDQATALHQQGYFKVRHSKLYLLDSEENSLSDIELNSIFTTLISYSTYMYDLSVCPPEVKAELPSGADDKADVKMSEQLQNLLQTLRGSDRVESRSGSAGFL